jgi:dihydrofolate synthase/folylpolyglutamate synthase
MRMTGRLRDYELRIPLLGDYQMENAATAVAAIEILLEAGHHIPYRSITKGMANVKWPGRMQVLARNPFVIADGAHNPYSAGRLREGIQKHFVFKRATLIIGTSADKDIGGIVAELSPVFDRVIVTRSVHPRALDTAALLAEFRRRGINAEAADDITIALPMALGRCTEDDLICITGSLFVVAGAIEMARTGGLPSAGASL